MQQTIAIIGAGLTGLSIAHRLSLKGIKTQVFDKNTHVGGAIRTLRDGDFLIEAGPNTGVYSNPELVEIFDSLKGKCELHLANPEAQKRLIWYKNRWEALPSGLLSGITTPLFSWKDKLGMLAEPFRPKGQNPHESIADLVRRRMGTSFLNYAVNPFISGIYAGDPERLITQYAFPKLYNLEQNYGSFIRGAIAKAREPKTALEKRATKEVFSVKDGMQKLPQALSLSAEKVHLGCNNLTVDKTENGYCVAYSNAQGESRRHTFSKVISTIGSYALPSVFTFVEKQEWAPIVNLQYAKVIQVALGYKNWQGRPLKAFGGLVPGKEKRNILGILFPSAIFDGRAPRGGALLSVFLGGMKRPDLFERSDEEITQLVMDEVKQTMGLSAAPDVMHIFRYSHAIPQYFADTKERLSAITHLESKHEGLVLAGNIRDGIGIANRSAQAAKVVNELIS